MGDVMACPAGEALGLARKKRWVILKSSSTWWTTAVEPAMVAKQLSRHAKPGTDEVVVPRTLVSCREKPAASPVAGLIGDLSLRMWPVFALRIIVAVEVELPLKDPLRTRGGTLS